MVRVASAHVLAVAARSLRMPSTSLTDRLATRVAPALAAVALIAAVPAAASAAPAWLPPAPLSAAGGAASAPDVAFDPSGDALVVWTRYDGAKQRAQAAYRPAGGSFGAPVTLSAAGVDATHPVVAVDAAGTFVVAYGQGGEVDVVVRPAGGGFSAPVPVSDTGLAAAAPAIAMNAGGTAVITWVLDGRAQATIRRPDGTFAVPRSLSPSTGVTAQPPYGFPRPAIDAAGDAIVVWDRSNGTTRVVESSYRPAGGAFEAAQTVNAGGNVGAVFPDVALDASGNATVVWEDCTASPSVCDAIKTNARLAGSGAPYLGTETIYGPTGAFSAFPRVAVDADGTATAIWYGEAGGNRVWTATRPLNRSFSTPEALSSASGATRFTTIRFAPDGTAIAAWNRLLGSQYAIQATTRPKGGAFGGVTNVSALGVTSEAAPGLGTDAQGDAIAVWPRAGAGGDVIEAAGYDAAPPRISGLSVPGSGTAGAPVALGASVTDVWSAVTPSWSFGDGLGATGASVQHAFAAPGSYTATLTATDALGFSASASGPIAVAAAPAPAPAGGGGGGGGPARVPVVGGDVRAVFTPHKRYATVTALEVLRAPAGATITVRCLAAHGSAKGPGCPLATKKVQLKAAAATTRLTSSFTTKKKVKGSKKRTRTVAARLAVGVRLTVSVTAPGRLGRTFTYTVRARRAPSRVVGCTGTDGRTAVACPA